MKHIIPNGPHHLYQCDLWELDKNIVSKIEYRYILNIKDCFSKWMWSYPLKNKCAETVLREIKKFIR